MHLAVSIEDFGVWNRGDRHWMLVPGQHPNAVAGVDFMIGCDLG
jgi:hypothetical protein